MQARCRTLFWRMSRKPVQNKFGQKIPSRLELAERYDELRRLRQEIGAILEGKKRLDESKTSFADIEKP